MAPFPSNQDIAAIEAARQNILSFLKENPGLHPGHWLESAWDTLNLREPSVDINYPWNLGDSTLGGGDEDVPTRALVGGRYDWGKIHYRQESYHKILHGLLEDQPPFNTWLGRVFGNVRDQISLSRREGPIGPLYQVNQGGNHRTQVIKALNIPRFPAKVQVMKPLSVGEEVIIPKMSKRALKVIKKRGYIGPTVSRFGQSDLSVTLERPLPVFWALRSPEQVKALAQQYAVTYPAFRDTELHFQMTDNRMLKDLAYLPE